MKTTEKSRKNLKWTVKNFQHCPSKSDLANSIHYLSGRELGSNCCRYRNRISRRFSSGWCVSAEVQGAPVTVKLMKGAAGIGFTLEGGKGSIHGDRPLVINRIFKGESAFSQRKGKSPRSWLLNRFCWFSQHVDIWNSTNSRILFFLVIFFVSYKLNYSKSWCWN